jgi:hypothetical protein
MGVVLCHALWALGNLPPHLDPVPCYVVKKQIKNKAPFLKGAIFMLSDELLSKLS